MFNWAARQMRRTKKSVRGQLRRGSRANVCGEERLFIFLLSALRSRRRSVRDREGPSHRWLVYAHGPGEALLLAFTGGRGCAIAGV